MSALCFDDSLKSTEDSFFDRIFFRKPLLLIEIGQFWSRNSLGRNWNCFPMNRIGTKIRYKKHERNSNEKLVISKWKSKPIIYRLVHLTLCNYLTGIYIVQKSIILQNHRDYSTFDESRMALYINWMFHCCFSPWKCELQFQNSCA